MADCPHPSSRAQAERGDRAQLAPGAHVYTDAEQTALEADLSRLEDAAKRQRKRARTLMRLHNLYARRVPEAEEADARLGEMLDQFKRRIEGACAARSWRRTHGAFAAARSIIACKNMIRFHPFSLRLAL